MKKEDYLLIRLVQQKIKTTSKLSETVLQCERTFTYTTRAPAIAELIAHTQRKKRQKLQRSARSNIHNERSIIPCGRL